MTRNNSNSRDYHPLFDGVFGWSIGAFVLFGGLLGVTKLLIHVGKPIQPKPVAPSYVSGKVIREEPSKYDYTLTLDTKFGEKQFKFLAGIDTNHLNNLVNKNDALRIRLPLKQGPSQRHFTLYPTHVEGINGKPVAWYN